MEEIGKIAVLALIAVILCVLIKEGNKPLSVILELAGCMAVLLMGLRVLGPILETVKKIQTISEIGDPLIEPLIKVVGISMVTNMAVTVCMDAGETALQKAVEISGAILALYMSLPLILAALELIEKLIGGMR